MPYRHLLPISAITESDRVIIQERLSRLEELSSKEARPVPSLILDAFWNNAPDVFVIADQTTAKFLYISPAWRQLEGCKSSVLNIDEFPSTTSEVTYPLFKDMHIGDRSRIVEDLVCGHDQVVQIEWNISQWKDRFVFAVGRILEAKTVGELV